MLNLKVKGKAKAINAGPRYFDNKPVIVKPWSADVSLEKATKMLSKFASVVGKPLYTDIVTTKRSRLAYANLCGN